ncbi:MAG: four helix bundle protein [Planctomycetaceae bacterium]
MLAALSSYNIAGGFERGGNNEFVQFRSISKGSCGEVRSRLDMALNKGHLSQDEFQDCYNRCLEISRLLDGFISSLKNSELKGRKFRP